MGGFYGNITPSVGGPNITALCQALPHQQFCTMASITEPHQLRRTLRWYLLLNNPSKTTHLGTLLRCAAAYQVHQFLLVGCDKFNFRGSFGSHLFLDIVAFRSWESVGTYLRLGGDDTIDTHSSDEVQNNVIQSDTRNDDSKCSMNRDANSCRGKEEIHTGKEEKAEQCRHPITIIGILGAYGGGEEIFSPNGAEVYIDEDSNVSLVPSNAVEQLNVECNQAHHVQKDAAATSCIPSHSFPISVRLFPSEDVCFMLSKDKRGLPLSQARLCSRFVHVPHLSFDNYSSPKIQQQPSQAMPETHGTHIAHSTLIDTATTLSIVLHHYTAWVGYEERSFADNQKFVKDVRPNARRRLCRFFCEDGTTTRQQEEESIENSEEDGIESMTFWNVSGGVANQSSDY